jgi:cytochrome c2
MSPLTRRAVAVSAVLALLAVAAVTVFGLLVRDRYEPPFRLANANAQRGEKALGAYGCIHCHTIPGVHGADATVGPPLDRWADRGYVGGTLPNTPRNLVRWITAPQSVVPGNAMPDLGVPEPAARDIAAYLYSLH